MGEDHLVGVHRPDVERILGAFLNEELLEHPMASLHVESTFLEERRQLRSRGDSGIGLKNVPTSEQLLFISQPNIGDSFSRMAAELAADPDVGFDIVYKLHPHEYYGWRATYPELVDADSTVVDSDDPPLYELFARSSAQVRVFSTAIYEGLSFDLDTYLIDLLGIEHHANLYRDGPAKLVGSSQELRQALARPESGIVDPERFFNSNAIANVEEAFSTIEQDLQ